MTASNTNADLVDVVRNFREEPHQIEALRYLQDSLTEKQHSEFTKKWRQNPVAQQKRFPLDIPYFYQRDSRTWQGERMCQSSSIAMRIKQIDSSLIKDDDDYLSIVNRFGDTTSQVAHKKALDHLGLSAQFVQDGDQQLLCDLLDDGVAVPIGVLHKGAISKPSGGGHWIVLTGYDQKYFYVNDPFGEMDLINGGYVLTGPTDGINQHYTRKSLMKRWLIHSLNDGWLWIIKK